MTFKDQKGQIALIVLTIMAVSLTLGLSLSDRVITDTTVTEQEEESSKAFSAAEAGIEEALRQLSNDSTSASLDAESLGVDEVDIEINQVDGGDEFVYPRPNINPGEYVTFWLAGHDDEDLLDPSSPDTYEGSEVYLCWSGEAAVEIMYFFDNTRFYQVERFGVDPNDTRRTENSFSASDSCNQISAEGFDRQYTIDTSGIPLFIVVRPLYDRTRFAIAAEVGSDLPTQGYEVYSTGKVNVNEVETVNRRIRVFQSWDSFRSGIWSGLFVGGGIDGTPD